MEPGGFNELPESDLEEGGRRDNPKVSAQGLLSVKRSLSAVS